MNAGKKKQRRAWRLAATRSANAGVAKFRVGLRNVGRDGRRILVAAIAAAWTPPGAMPAKPKYSAKHIVVPVKRPAIAASEWPHHPSFPHSCLAALRRCDQSDRTHALGESGRFDVGGAHTNHSSARYEMQWHMDRRLEWIATSALDACIGLQLMSVADQSLPFRGCCFDESGARRIFRHAAKSKLQSFCRHPAHAKEARR